jgi:fatty acid kinase fatty acid binding subunit
MLAIVTDSTSDLPREERERHNITVVPENVIFGSQTYQDEIDITPERLYQMLPTAKTHPTTSQPSAGEFIKYYRPLIQAGKEIVSIHLSSKLSGTYSSAVAAKFELEAELKKVLPITILDTPWISMALGMLCLVAAQAAQSGKSRDQVVAAVNALVPKLNIIFVLDTLEYLKRGGRIGAASAMLGTMLNFKPMLTLKDGAVHPLEKPRSRAKAVRRLMEMLEESALGKPLHAAVLNADALDEANAVAKEIRSQYDCREFYSIPLGPVIGVHTGPGTIGLAFYTD